MKSLVIFESNSLLQKKVIDDVLRKASDTAMAVSENYTEKSCLDIKIRAISDYDDLRELREEVDEICTSVLKSLLENPTLKSTFTVDGTYFLKLIREELGFLLEDIIREVLVIERIISREKPSKIVVFESHNLLTVTLPIPLGKIVTHVANKHSIDVSVRSFRLSRWFLKVKGFLVPLVFLRMSFKRYTLVRIKPFFWSDLRTRSKKSADVKQKTVLFIPYSDAEQQSMESIVERLSGFKEVSCLAIAYPYTDEKAKLFENQWGC